MTSVDVFFQSVRDVFARNRETDWTEVGLLLGGAVFVSIVVSLVIARHRSRSEVTRRIDAVTVRAGLTRQDLDYLGTIAARAKLPLLEVMTRLPAFERATAAALASQAETLRPVPGSAFERIRRLRKVLGHSPLPAHHWLLSTRELLLGDPVTVGGSAANGKVVEVSEASFAIDLPASAVPAVSGSAVLAIVRTDDSRYLSRTRVLAAEPAPGPAEGSGVGWNAGSSLRRVFFTHDEQPERQQNRAHVRVRLHGAVTLRIVEHGKKSGRTGAIAIETGRHQTGQSGAGAGLPEPEAAPELAPPEPVEGTMVDVSAGGLAMDLPLPPSGQVRRGSRVRCSFVLGPDAAFSELAAVIAAAAPGARPGTQHLRLSFVALPDAERDRLAAAVAKHQRPTTPEPPSS